MRSAFARVFQSLGLCLFVTQFSGAFETAAMQKPKYFYCMHTKRKIEKGKPCPCGCDKRLKALARAKLLSADHPCAEEADRAILPVFARWIFTGSTAMLLQTPDSQRAFFVETLHHTPYFPEKETPPPRCN
ncbi:MAG: hypothetical protein NZL89_05740 [Leptospiraceae bacterium]|nr:hypothetical protein [Leptospiraceae bacterium]